MTHSTSISNDPSTTPLKDSGRLAAVHQFTTFSDSGSTNCSFVNSSRNYQTTNSDRLTPAAGYTTSHRFPSSTSVTQDATSVITRSPGSGLAASRYSSRSRGYPPSPALPSYNNSSMVHSGYFPSSNLVAQDTSSTGFHSSGSGLVCSRSSIRSHAYSSLPTFPSRNAFSTFPSSYSSSGPLWSTFPSLVNLRGHAAGELLKNSLPEFGYHVSPICLSSHSSDDPQLFRPDLTGCFLRASAVQLHYWPTPYTTPVNNLSISHETATRTAVDRGGYIYTSPSVYVVYSGLSGDNLKEPGPTFYISRWPTGRASLVQCFSIHFALQRRPQKVSIFGI